MSLKLEITLEPVEHPSEFRLKVTIAATAPLEAHKLRLSIEGGSIVPVGTASPPRHPARMGSPGRADRTKLEGTADFLVSPGLEGGRAAMVRVTYDGVLIGGRRFELDEDGQFPLAEGSSVLVRLMGD